jgi:hypothetical protein
LKLYNVGKMKYLNNCISPDFPKSGRFPWFPDPMGTKSITQSTIESNYVNLFERRTMGGIHTGLGILLACDFRKEVTQIGMNLGIVGKQINK